MHLPVTVTYRDRSVRRARRTSEKGSPMFGDVSAFCALGFIIAITIVAVGVLPLVYIVVLIDRESPARRIEGLLKALAAVLRALRRK